jgi:peptidylprolyl isomerase
MIKENDCVKIEYDAYDSESMALFDTTSKETAKKHGLEQEGKNYGAIKLIIGKGFAIKGLEESLIGKKEGDNYEEKIPAIKGFGIWTQNLTENLKISAFTDKQINPVKGMFVNIDGRMARIAFVGNRLVKVDYNHPLSNKDLLYKVKVIKIITDEKDIINCAIEGLMGEEVKSEIIGEELVIKSNTPIPEDYQKLLEKELKTIINEGYKVAFKKE